VADRLCNGRPPRRRKPPRSDFAIAASAVGRDLHAARERIARLERLSKGTSLFNDPVVEIDQLKLLLKQDVHRLGAAIEALSRAPLDGRQLLLHRDGVAASLRSSLSAATTAFQQALAQREASLSAREQRAARLASVAQTPSLPLATSSALHRRSAAARSKGPVRNGHADADMEAGGGSVALEMGDGDGGGGDQHQQTYWAPRSLREREAAVSTMQSTLAELGGMFQKLSGLVAQQAELVTRIDADLDDTTASMDSAQAQLHKYYRAIQGNRGLIIKAFIVLLIVIGLWSVVGRSGRRR